VDFLISSNVDMVGFVDLHYRLNGGELVNVRMSKLSEQHWQLSNIMLKAGDLLEYFFTYCVTIEGQKIDCNTGMVQYALAKPQPITIPPPLVCPAIEFSQALQGPQQPTATPSAYIIDFLISSNVDMVGFVDLHFKINGGELRNVRMNKLSEQHWQFSDIKLKAGDSIDYFFTYCVTVGGRTVDCNTQIINLALPAPVMAPTECEPLNITQGLGRSAEGPASFNLVFQANAPVEMNFVDAHFTVNGGQLINMRMHKITETRWELPLSVNRGDNLSVFFTYCYMLPNGGKCDINTAVTQAQVN